MTTAPADTDWLFCRQSLIAVSRSFSKPIEMLPDDLQRAVTTGYLLCRIADTIEDHPTLPPERRGALFAYFLAVLEGDAEPRGFERAFGSCEPAGTPGELELAGGLRRVMRVFWALPAPLQAAVVPWVAEMTRGMALYSHRLPGPDGLRALLTLSDLERYCWFVAGTVGHMLTDLFQVALPLDRPCSRALRARAEEFGLGLQLVNILKDVTDDHARGWSFVPRQLCEDAGIEVKNLPDPLRRAAAHRAVAPIFDRAHAALDQALEYCVTLPSEHRAVRMFCLLPLWMAARTLAHARGNDDQFVAGRPVKISREEVALLVGDCAARAHDDAALREGWAALKARG